ncbi:MFS transporter [Candidatus Nitrosocosmicus franklandus]|uniref:Multidrug resistance protein 3 n=1 Tax=Candidatus Nitrosocosmicus franklandianus TaxID=1798806 RepID=A0A484IBD0_9ARCH|nr:MFS transporter [Candidatus Nitrosocosmicus franklandus]VFJ14615.1 Multidrug resistance protein 3 [Candidatus Nitrosocosmicus franklandus]
MKNSESSERIHVSTWITLAILGSTILITMYGETMLLPAIGDIIKEFDISYSTSSWILTAYLISGAVMTPIAGKLSDIYGRKKMVLIIFVIYIVGIAIGGISSNIYMLILARVIQGIGISMFPIAFGIIKDQFPSSKIAIGVGIFSSMFAAGSVVGMAIGGTIIKNFGWQATFFTIIPIAIILWIIIQKRIRNDDHIQIIKATEVEKRLDSSNTLRKSSDATNIHEKQHIDIKGALSLAFSISSFLLTITYFASINSESHDSTSLDGIILASLIALTILSTMSFVLIEKRVKEPLIPLKLITDKILLPSNIILLVFGITMFMVYQTIPILVTSPTPYGFGGDAIQSAMVQLPFMIVFLIFAPSSGFIVSKIGNFKPIIVGSILTTIGFTSLFLFHVNELTIALNLVVISAGLALTQVGAFNITLQHTPHRFSGVSIGISVVLVLMGSSIGPVIASTFMQTFQEITSEINIESYPAPLSYNLIFLTATIISLASFPCMILLRKRTLNTLVSKIGKS